MLFVDDAGGATVIGVVVGGDGSVDGGGASGVGTAVVTTVVVTTGASTAGAAGVEAVGGDVVAVASAASSPGIVSDTSSSMNAVCGSKYSSTNANTPTAPTPITASHRRRLDLLCFSMACSASVPLVCYDADGHEFDTPSA
jgi:hypothetical protein